MQSLAGRLFAARRAASTATKFQGSLLLRSSRGGLACRPRRRALSSGDQLLSQSGDGTPYGSVHSELGIDRSKTDPSIAGGGKKSLEQEIFQSIDKDASGTVSSEYFLSLLHQCGIQDDDPRMTPALDKIRSLAGGKDNQSPNMGARKDLELTQRQFKSVCSKNSVLIQKALMGKLVVPDFQEFTKELEEIYHEVKQTAGGTVAQYIPQLRKQNPDHFAISVCTIDGQQWSVGQDSIPFCVQSTSKPISYLMAAEEHGFDKVHYHVGREPSGVKFNKLTLKELERESPEQTPRRIPHNPMINAGAIMSCSLIRNTESMAERFATCMDTWKKLCGNSRISFDNPTYLSERDSADRNFCLGYMMKEYNAFPVNNSLKDTLELYFQCCSIKIDNRQSAMVGATLANGGVNPTTGERVFSSKHVRNCLSLMLSSGMYDFSGEWSFTVGLPAKSGVAGLIYIVVPNKMGIAIWSPPLDDNGNSWRGVEVAKKLVERFNFHQYDNLRGVLSGKSKKKDPTLKKKESAQNDTISMLFAAAEGDVREVQRLQASGVDLYAADYDARSALHLAASEGHEEVVTFILQHALSQCASSHVHRDLEMMINPQDRWKRTPLDDAVSGGHEVVASVLREAGCAPSDETQAGGTVLFESSTMKKSFGASGSSFGL